MRASYRSNRQEKLAWLRSHRGEWDDGLHGVDTVAVERMAHALVRAGFYSKTTSFVDVKTGVRRMLEQVAREEAAA